MNNGISVIIPVFNSSASLKELKEKISFVLMTSFAGILKIIFVNDTSSDNSWKILKLTSRR